jgi:hypothetical protein
MTGAFGEEATLSGELAPEQATDPDWSWSPASRQATARRSPSMRSQSRIRRA